MTNKTLSIFNQLRPVTVGFDNVFDHFERMIDDHNFNTMTATNFPPYNIVKTGEYTYDVELALAGFSKDDIDVDYQDSMLTVKSKEKAKDADVDGMLHRGISKRWFSKAFTIADDVEVPNNSMTHMMREKLGETVKEFDAVLKPSGKIIYLGTPQNEMSLYNTLLARGYEMRVWPARYPTLERSEKAYGGRLAPLLYESLQTNLEAVYGLPTDPKRFDDTDLLERELSYGRSGFALQFMLDTSLSDANKYPLKLSDLMIYSCDKDTAPEKLVYGIFKPLPELPNVGLAGDKFYAPEDTIGRSEYTGSILAVDPSGRGSDETAYAVVKMLNGFLHVVDCGGIEGGYSEKTLQHLTDLAKIHKVNMVLVESNFGDGMFTELLKPYLLKTYPITIEEVRHSKQKEQRIIDTLEPVMNQHRLVVDPKVIQKDYDSVQHMPPDKAAKYMLTYQMTRITKQRGALAHDDRLDVLAMAVQYWTDQMAADADTQIQSRKEELLDNELDKFMSHLNLGTKDTGESGWLSL